VIGREQVPNAMAAAGRALRLGAAALLALPLLLLVHPASSVAATQPVSVTVVGNLQSELGCSTDWMPDCPATRLTYDPADDVWQGTWILPAGQWEYKVALNGSFDENYGANATPNGPNIMLDLTAGTTVKFYYDHKTHWITDSRDSVIAIAAGDFQSELGCSSDWDPSCLRSWLEDPDGNGTYQFFTDAIPAGVYQAKVAINENWDESYGAGGAPDGANIDFTVPANATTAFSYDPISHVLSVTSTTGTMTSITSDAPDPSAAGQPVTVQYRVAPSSGTGAPTGTVTVSDGTASCTGTVAAGRCSLTFTSAGTKSLTASYSGDGNFNPSTSAFESHTVNPANASPTATVTGGQCSTANVASGMIKFTLFDAEGDPLTLAFAANSNPGLVPNANIVLGGTGANRTLSVAAAAKKTGQAAITLNLSDGKVTVPVMVTMVVGSDQSETLNGTSGADMMFGLSGQNIIKGNAGNDLLCGGNGGDTIGGGDGDDTIDGGNGGDTISGGDGNDTLRGGSGNDTLTGGIGADLFSGGPGADRAADLDPAQDTQDGTIP
jgi:Ca2+-binding RTX toxin-like protein